MSQWVIPRRCAIAITSASLATSAAARRGHGLFAAVLLEVAAVYKLHHQERMILVKIEVKDPDQIGMLQIDQQPAFLDQTGLVIRGDRPMVQLEHQVVAQLDVDDPVDVRLAAFVNQTDDLVSADRIRQRAVSFGRSRSAATDSGPSGSVLDVPAGSADVQS